MSEQNNVVPINDTHTKLKAVISEILEQKQGTTVSAQDAVFNEIIKKASAKVPSWVIYAAVGFLGPSFGAFYVTAQSVWSMPKEVSALKIQVAEQSKAIAEIKSLLQSATTQKVQP